MREPTQAAIRAAAALAEAEGRHWQAEPLEKLQEWARTIEQASGIGELLEAAKRAHRAFSRPSEANPLEQGWAVLQLEEAIARAERGLEAAEADEIINRKETTR